MAAMSNSIWGKSDCLTEILGDFRRPEFLRTADSVTAVANFKKMFNGDIKKGVEWFAGKYATGYERIRNNNGYKPGDVVIGKTREYDFAIAKVGKHYRPVIRTEIGYSDASFIDIIGIWRPR